MAYHDTHSTVLQHWMNFCCSFNWNCSQACKCKYEDVTLISLKWRKVIIKLLLKFKKNRMRLIFTVSSVSLSTWNKIEKTCSLHRRWQLGKCSRRDTAVTITVCFCWLVHQHQSLSLLVRITHVLYTRVHSTHTFFNTYCSNAAEKQKCFHPKPLGQWDVSATVSESDISESCGTAVITDSTDFNQMWAKAARP